MITVVEYKEAIESGNTELSNLQEQLRVVQSLQHCKKYRSI